ncbi:hypothetical protein F5Y00DRAFT_162197 [Daldinia vernicosa]|uniref:uncharacterized protein n=1 Tax=Daldinia vernicosa TaxID=114800 RepID=UPI0020080937|nr:uncharacterized protein F5Y00DRAFT_162197 [Daldinia vernicosa]KAI0845743.1 hypothetical protein F5Y00DRAFT_162197 [Daldinia vernicosa]
MAFDTSRPSTQNGGSRPPTSRFVEGSMNDRVSAAPPKQFLEPGQLKEYEKQFYAEPSIFQRDARKTRRPFSESSMSPRAKLQDHIITHRKSTGFFGRVRDALGWTSSSSSSSSSKSSSSTHKMDQVRKHKSLQEPLQRQTPPAPQPEHLRAAKSHSEMYNLPHLSNLGNGAARPSREDVLESYNQLMASGFFQSHAIQSTRHAPPGSRNRDRYSTPPMPAIPGSGPCSPQPPPRTSSIDATNIFKAARLPLPGSPLRASFQGRRIETPEPEDEPMHMPGAYDTRRPTLRSRKRSRLDTEDPSSVEAPGTSTSSSFVEPLKRVAKKLRKMPSPIKDLQASDSFLQLPPSPTISTRGTSYLKEITVRMRSSSPAPAPVPVLAPVSRGIVGRRVERIERIEHQRPPSSLSNSSRDGGRLRKRGKSSSLRSRTSSTESENWEVLGDRSSMEDVRHDEMDILFPPRSRELPPLSVVPDANRGIPMVPRIPDQYSYHKPRIYYHQDENLEANCFYGEAL